MKTKILLFVSLVLLAVQGWAMPVDSLVNQLPSGSLTELDRVALINASAPSNGFKNGEKDLDTKLQPRSRSIDTKGTDSFLWNDRRRGEYMYFSFDRQNTEALLGTDTVLYLTAHTGLIKSPLYIKLLNDNGGVFDFQDEIIYPDQLTPMDTIDQVWHWGDSQWCGKRMRIGFRPTSVGDYTATFQINNSSSVLYVTLLITVVDNCNEHVILVSSKDLSFYCEIGSTDTEHLTVTARNLSDPLKLEIIPYTEYAVSYGENSCDLIDDDSHLWDRLLFDIEGSIKDDTYYGEGASEYALISPEQAAQGAKVTIKYKPTWAGYHQAKIRITGDGLSEDIILHGNAKGKLNVNPSVLNFPNDNYDSANPQEGYYIQSFTVTGSGLSGDSVYVDLNNEMFSILGYDRFSSIEVEQQGATVWVQYNPTDLGTHTANISIKGGGSIESKTVHLIGTTNYPTISVNPSSIEFPNKAVGETESQTFRVTGLDLTGPLTLTLDDSDGGQFSIDKDHIDVDQALNGVNITVFYTPTAAGAHSGRVSITGGGAAKSTVTLSGNAIDPPLIAVNKSSLLLDDVVVGDYKTDEFTISGWNLTSTLELNLTGATNVFSINKTIISPNQDGTASATITVTYRPTAAGTQTAIVTICGENAVDKVVNLTGKAVVREIKTNPAHLTFSQVTIGESMTQPFMVTATSPNAPLNLKLNDNTGMFSLNNGKTTTTITAEEAANGSEVIVKYKPTSTGSHVASITITGGGALEEKIVMLNGSAVPAPPTVTPSSLALTDVVVGQYKTDEFTVKGANLTENLILTLTGATNVFSINKTVISPSNAAAGQTIKVTYKPTNEGTQTAKVTISGGGTNKTKTVNLTGTAIVRKITTDNSALTFSSQTVDKAVSKTFKITGTNLTGAVTVKLNDKTGMFSINKTTATVGATVTVTYKPTASGSHVASITLYGGGAPEEKIVSLNGSAVVRKITTSDLNVTFYNTPVNKAVTRNLTVTGTNLTGSLTVKLNDGTGMYSITPTTLPASGGTVKVTYKPTAKGSHTATISISGGSALESITVNLKGTAVVPTITTSVSSLSFAAAISKTFNVTGSNLTGSLSLKSNNTKFTVSPSTITAAEAMAGKTIIVTYHDTDGSTSANGIITISGGDASSKTVSLTYRKGQAPQISSVEMENDDNEGRNEINNVGSQEAFGATTSDVDELSMSSKIYADGQNIVIESPEEQNALISDLAGRARNVSLQVGRNEIPVNASGIYIVRIREKTTKLIIK